MMKNATANSDALGIEAVRRIGPDAALAYVPPLADYKDPSPGWTETEYRVLANRSATVTVGYWAGEPGSVSFDAWPYTEVCSILSGRVGLRDLQGREMEFGAGEAFIVPKGWPGTWLTLEGATKIFVAID